MKLLITGGTGFIGHLLVAERLAKGDEITVLSRQQPTVVKKMLGGSVRVVSDFQQLGADTEFNAVVNLAGEGILDKSWTDERKEILRSSRIGVTAALTGWLRHHHVQPEVMISGSAVGYYGSRESGLYLSEESEPGHDFAADLCQDWERAAEPALDLGIRLCFLRTGIVLHPSYGALAKMLPPFQFGLGGRVGAGRQMMSWIHIQDMINAISFLLEKKSCSGAFNLTAPEPVANIDFSRILAEKLHRPAIFPVPAFLLKMMLGEGAILLLEGQTVLPTKLQREGFQFQYERLGPALAHLLGK